VLLVTPYHPTLGVEKVILFTLCVGDLAKAVRNGSDLHFGLYHSMFEWFHPLYKEDKLNNYTTRKFVQVSCICCTQWLV